MLVRLHSLTGAEQPDFLYDFDIFLETSLYLVLVGDWKAIMDKCLDCVKLTGSGAKLCELIWRYRLGFSNVTVWTWANKNSSPRLHLEGIFCRRIEKHNIVCPQFKLVDYTDHKFGICTVDVDRLHRQESGYLKKLNSSFPEHQENQDYRDKIRKEVRWGSAGTIVYSQWLLVLKRAINLDKIKYSRKKNMEVNYWGS